MKLSFIRLEKYIAVRPTAAMMDMIAKLMVEVISILGIATKEIVQGQFRMSSNCPYLFDIMPKSDVSRREIHQEAVWIS